ncbi:hypothetical protein Gasu2_64390 [Galdieria sulphuraria]|nr:hypothetical protein Gasu2_64390 [Galdieria sulphuraria]
MTHNFLYRCPKSTVPYHLTLPNLHPHVHYEGSGAGNIVFTAMQLKLINGYGSAFWGWGREDDNMVKRFKALNLWPFEVPEDTHERFFHIDCSPQRTETSLKEQELIEILRNYSYAIQSMAMNGYSRV